MINIDTKTVYTLVGVGIGPSNLSTASLLFPFKDRCKSLFLETKPQFRWHPGMMFSKAKLQVSILKDLVTMVDPTSVFSFLNYLREKDRLYLFAAKNGFDSVTRMEFEDYFLWVISKMDNLEFNATLNELKIGTSYFELITDRKTLIKATNVVLGVGLSPKIPDCCISHMSDKVVHSSQFLLKKPNLKGKEVAVVGGGQSACEIMEYLMNCPEDKRPKHINWIFSEDNLKAMQNSPFDNEYFTPDYSDYFYHMDSKEKSKILGGQKYTSDGISGDTIERIYDLLYDNKIRPTFSLKIHNNTTLRGIEKSTDFYELHLDKTAIVHTECVILCTGYKNQPPKLLDPLSHLLLKRDGLFQVDTDYSLLFKEPKKYSGKIYIHNGIGYARGIANPNLSLMARRSAVILNSLLQEEVYNVNLGGAMLPWQ